MKNIAYVTSKKGSLLEKMIESKLFTQYNLIVFNDTSNKILKKRCKELRIPYVVFNNFNELNSLLKKKEIDIVFTAGYLKILPKQFINKWRNRILNCHPGIEGYEGLHPQKRMIADNATYIGQYLHLIDETLDRGPILYQMKYINIFQDEKKLNDFLRANLLIPLQNIFDNFDTIKEEIKC